MKRCDSYGDNSDCGGNTCFDCLIDEYHQEILKVYRDAARTGKEEMMNRFEFHNRQMTELLEVLHKTDVLHEKIFGEDDDKSNS